MPFRIASILCLAATVTANHLPNILFKDVVIIGGGASGAYAAVRLRDDYGKSMALVEMRETLVSITASNPRHALHRMSNQD